MCFKPLSERSGVDLHDGRFGEGVRADEFIVGRMEGYGDDTGFSADAFRAPREIPRIEAEGAVFVISAAYADHVDAFRADTGVRWLATLFECSDSLLGQREVSRGWA